MHVIYALEDPRDTLVFYVGLTTDLVTRYMQHISCADDNEAKNKRIHELGALGMLPLPRTLETCHGGSVKARVREEHWISYYRQQGAPLANETHKRKYLLNGQLATSKYDLYNLLESEIDQFKAAYRANPNIDKALAAIDKGTHYREAARRVIQVYGLREEA